MPKNKKQFIPKNKGVTFHLVHRSQQDPLVADETAPQHVLVQEVKNEKKRKNADEEHKFGIYYDDDYDYLQHLKNSEDVEVLWQESGPSQNARRSGDKKVQLPSSVFASNVEETVGLLNKAAPVTGLQLDLGDDVVDIVAAMDDDFDFNNPDNELEDNFMELANCEGFGESDDEKYSDNESIELDSDERCELSDEELDSLPCEFHEMETKSRFTNYSMTSSIMRRNDQLSLLDDRFEELFKGYEKGEIGPLDCEEIEGAIPSCDRRLLDLIEDGTDSTGVLEENAGLKEKILSLMGDEEPEQLEKIVEVDKDKWDCESILSTYSNIYNHPSKIIEPKGPRKIKVDRSGMPVDELEGRGGPKLTAKNLSALDSERIGTAPRSIISMVSELSQRPKDETPEERRLRKQNLREYRRERRKERKANTLAFTEEKLRQEKVLMNLRNNLRGVKIL